MSTKTTSNNNSVIAIIFLIITFPLWIGVVCGFFGVAIGIIGAVVGIIGAVFGAIFGAIGSVFDFFNWFSFPHFHISAFRFFVIVAIIFAVVMMSRSKRKQS